MSGCPTPVVTPSSSNSCFSSIVDPNAHILRDPGLEKEEMEALEGFQKVEQLKQQHAKRVSLLRTFIPSRGIIEHVLLPFMDPPIYIQFIYMCLYMWFPSYVRPNTHSHFYSLSRVVLSEELELQRRDPLTAGIDQALANWECVAYYRNGRCHGVFSFQTLWTWIHNHCDDTTREQWYSLAQWLFQQGLNALPTQIHREKYGHQLPSWDTARLRYNRKRCRAWHFDASYAFAHQWPELPLVKNELPPMVSPREKKGNALPFS